MSSSPGADSLPQVALVLVLEQLNLSQRLSCALVATAWAEAVAAATSSVVVAGGRAAGVDVAVVERWIQKHGASLTKLQLVGHGEWHELPCRKLQELQLHSASSTMRMHLSTGMLYNGLAKATGLTRLSLAGLLIQDAVALDSALLALTNLRDLGVCLLHTRNKQDVPTHNEHSVMPNNMYYLQHLTRLAVEGQITDATLSATAASQQMLKHLELGGLPYMMLCVSSGRLAQVGKLQALTCLEIKSLSYSLTKAEAPKFSRLTSLKRLVLSTTSRYSAAISAAVLKAVSTQLQELHLHFIRLLRDGGANNRSAAASSFLAVLRKLQCLKRLSLAHEVNLHAAPPGDFTSLTSSADLEHLALSGTISLHRLFPPGKTLQQLSTVDIIDTCALEWLGLEQLLHARPSLKALQIICAPLRHDHERPSPPRQLLSLTKLRLGLANGPILAWLAPSLTGLLELGLVNTHVSIQGLQALTSLTQLSCMQFDRCSVYRTEEDATLHRQQLSMPWEDPLLGAQKNRCYTLQNKAPDGSDPDVMAQLQAACNAAITAGQQEVHAEAVVDLWGPDPPPAQEQAGIDP